MPLWSWCSPVWEILDPPMYIMLMVMQTHTQRISGCRLFRYAYVCITIGTLTLTETQTLCANGR